MTPKNRLIFLSSVFVCTAGSSAVAEPPLLRAAVTGETLSVTDVGTGIVEDMQAVLARDREQARNNPESPDNRHGEWVIPTPRSTYFPASGNRYVTNKHGDTSMGIGFHSVVDVRGAFFSGQGGGPSVWARAIRVTGYLDGRRIGATDWFTKIGEEPEWFEMNLSGVDRIVIESQAAQIGAGWYAMDDLTFRRQATGANQPATTVLDFEDCRARQKLSGSNYAGLDWETGTGDVLGVNIIPAPVVPPGEEESDETDHAPPQEGPPGPRGSAVGPGLGTHWDSTKRGDAGQFSAPPDTSGAVGPNHIVVVVNRVFAVYDKSNGDELQQFSLGSFMPGSNGDPRVLYDQHSDRWVVVASNFSNRIYIAVSTSNNPTGSWFKSNFIASTGSDSGCFPDYPTLGVDAEGIYTASYMVGCGFTIFALDKAPLIDVTPGLGTITAFRGVASGTIQPVHTYGSPAGQYCMSRSGSTALLLHRVNPPLTSPTLTNLGTIVIPFHAFPPDVPALGSGTPLDSVDYRLMNAVYRDGSIWTAHNVEYNGRTGCRWYQVDTASMNLVQSGTIGSNTFYYWMPSIAVNANGDVGMGFSGANASQYAGAYLTGRRFNDPPGEMAEPIQMRQGDGAHNIIDSYGRNRWGDYSLTSLDPSNEQALWTVQEYAHGNNIWGTHVAKLNYGDTLPPSPFPEIITVIPTVDSVTLISSVATEIEHPPVEYYFESTEVLGADNRDWDLDPSFLDTGLSPDIGYAYRVKARDFADPPNESPLSEYAFVRTHAVVPGAPTLSNATQTTLDISVDRGGNPSVTELAIQCTATNPPDAAWQDRFADTGGNPSAIETWKTEDIWATLTLQTLQPGTEYTYAVKARNQVAVETEFGPSSTDSTLLPDEIVGDCDGSGQFVLGADMPCFVDAMLGIDTAPPGGIARSDLNGDGETDGKDINDFINCAVGGCP